MKQREFDALWCSEAVRFSGGQFRLAVESLDQACRDAAQGEEPVEDQRPVTPQAPCDLACLGNPDSVDMKVYRPEEIVAKLRDADAMLNAGKDLAAVLQALGDQRHDA